MAWMAVLFVLFTKREEEEEEEEEESLHRALYHSCTETELRKRIITLMIIITAHAVHWL